MEWLLQLDLEIFLFLNGLHFPAGDILFYWISNPYIWIPLYIFIIALIIKQWRKQAVMAILLLFLTAGWNDYFCNTVKYKTHRLRPSQTPELADQVHLVRKPDGTLYRGGKFSFPSAHAANSCVMVFFFGFFVRTRRKWPLILMIVWSLLLAYSRIYLGVHYPGDILAGYLIGSGWSCLVLYIWKKSPKVRGEWIYKSSTDFES